MTELDLPSLSIVFVTQGDTTYAVIIGIELA